MVSLDSSAVLKRIKPPDRQTRAEWGEKFQQNDVYRYEIVARDGRDDGSCIMSFCILTLHILSSPWRKLFSFSSIKHFRAGGGPSFGVVGRPIDRKEGGKERSL